MNDKIDKFKANLIDRVDKFIDKVTCLRIVLEKTVKLATHVIFILMNNLFQKKT